MTDQTAAPAEGQATDTTTAAPAPKTWYEGADPDTVGYIQNKKWDAETPLKVVESYRNLEKFHGVPADQIVKLPKADDVEGWNGVYGRLGRPESADKYAPVEGVEIDAEALKRFDGKFHAAGLNDTQRKAILTEYDAYSKQMFEEQEKALAQEKSIQTEALKKEWGANYDERVDLAKRAVRSFLPDTEQREQTLQAIENAVGPAVLAKMFANLADRIGEDKIITGADSGQRAYGYTKEQAVNDRNVLMAEIKADPARLAAYNRGLGSDVEKLTRLNKIMAGE